MDMNQAKTGKAIGIIMTYNCSHLLEDAYSRIPKESLQGIIIVDDHSKDWEKTQSIAQQLGIPFFTHEHLGYGGNLRYGLAKAMEMGADYMVEIHGDGQFDPSVIPAALQKMREGYDFILGSRFIHMLQPLRDGMPLIRYCANIILSFIDRLVLWIPLTELNNGFRVYSRNLVQTLPLEAVSKNHLYSFQVIVQAVYFKLRIGEIFIRCDYKKEHTSISLGEAVIYAFQTFYILFLYILARLGFKIRLFKKR